MGWPSQADGICLLNRRAKVPQVQILYPLLRLEGLDIGKSPRLENEYTCKSVLSVQLRLFPPFSMISGFVYKWTNLINGRWYIGSHAGHENDGYVGSGKAFRTALVKHGIENFVREILYRGNDFRKYEGSLLLELDAMHDSMSYNLINDGVGSSGRNNPMFGRHGKDHPMFGKPGPMLGRKQSAECITKRVSNVKRSGVFAAERNVMFGRKGEKCPNSKLTQAQADEIRVRIANGEKIKDLVIEFDVSRFTIARIRDNVIYIGEPIQLAMEPVSKTGEDKTLGSSTLPLTAARGDSYEHETRNPTTN